LPIILAGMDTGKILGIIDSNNPIMSDTLSDSESAPEVAASLAVPYKDRSVGLVIFGVLTILLGCLAGLMVLLMLVGQVACAAQAPASQPPASTMVLGAGVYGVLAVALVWLGIGSIMARRWARAMLLIFSWTWLGIGVLTMVFMVIFAPNFKAAMVAEMPPGQPALPPAALNTIMVFIFLVLAVVYIILPAAWTFFYHSRHVKTTCEARDPQTRWTDTCPLPVLGLSLWLMVSVPMFLLMPWLWHGVTPFFGMFLTGLPGSAVWLVLAGLWSYAAWLLYKLEARGWWLALILWLFFLVSTTLTYARHDLTEMYSLMGLTPEQLEPLKATGLMNGNYMIWLSLLWIFPLLGYMAWIKKYFRRSA